MEAFSRDLRVRVIKAYDEGRGSSRELARVFGVSSAWIWKLLRLRRESTSWYANANRITDDDFDKVAGSLVG